MSVSFDEQLLALGKLEAELTALNEKVQEKRAKLLAEMQAENLKKVESVFGVATLVERKSFDFSGFPEILLTKEKLAALQAAAKAEAPCSISASVRFAPNQPMIDAGMPKKKRAFRAAIIKTAKVKS